MDTSKKKTEARTANEELNKKLNDDNKPAADSKTEQANKELQERLENGEPSKGVNPDHYLANNENSLVIKGNERKKK